MATVHFVFDAAGAKSAGVDHQLVHNTSPRIKRLWRQPPVLAMDVRERLARTCRGGQGRGVVSPEAEGGTTQLPVDYGHDVELLGYQVEKPRVNPARRDVTTYWKATDTCPCL